jgi:hypothetical protein
VNPVPNVFLFRRRLHAILNGEVYVYVGESVVDQIAALSWRVRIEVGDGAWARCLSDQYIASLGKFLQAAVRRQTSTAC